MIFRHLFAFLTFSLCFIIPLHAQSNLVARHTEHTPRESTTNNLTLEQAIQQEQSSRLAEREAFEGHFDAAYAAFPNLPDGILQAMAFVNSRWIHITPDPHEEPAHGPPAYGVMGLYAGDGEMADLVGEGADLLGVSRETVMQDPAMNIMAAAALLDAYLQDTNMKKPALEMMTDALAFVSGIPATDEVGEFAVESFTYDVLLTLDRGIDQPGISVPQKRIDWEVALDVKALVRQKAPMVQVDLQKKTVFVPGANFDPISETLEAIEPENSSKKSSDYGPALWSSSPYHGSRTASVSAVTVHTTQGSYAGTLSWFRNNPYSVSAHYVIRSSDGQITQMVREYRRANHVGSENPYTIGLEHEGFVNTSAYYTTAMYNASSALVRDICADYGINPGTTYGGPAHSGVVTLSSSYKIRGHQHFPNQNHSDPGLYWDWARYKNLITGGSSGGGGGTSNITLLDTFETGEGHFDMSPAYSGSSYGISTASTAQRTSAIAYRDNYSMHVKLVDNPNTSSSWGVRFLSGMGRPSSNTSMQKAGGNIGFWVYSGGSGVEVAVGVDDSDGTERTKRRAIPAGQWTWVQWPLDDSAQWDAWVGGNGIITSSNVTLDAIWFFRANTSYNVHLYLDNVAYFKD